MPSLCGDTAQYDVVLDLGGRFISVQVKSTFFQASNLKPGNFVASLFHVNGPNRRYQQSDFDYLAVYCIPKDIWYIIPSAQPPANTPSASAPATNKINGNPTAKPGTCFSTAPQPPSKSEARSTSTASSKTTSPHPK